MDDFSITHATDYVARAVDYYPYGLEMAKVDEDPDLVYRYGYQGQYAELDTATGFNSFALRQYDARIGRFNTVDPYGQFFSPYVGMGNSPVNMVDPSGGWNWVAAGVGAAVGAGIGYVASDGDWRAALAGGLAGGVIGGASFSGTNVTTDFAGEINKFVSTTNYTFNPGVLTASLNIGIRLLETGQGGEQAINAFATSLRNLADSDAEQAFFKKYWRKIPGYKYNIINHEVTGNIKYVEGTPLKDFNLPPRMNVTGKDLGRSNVVINIFSLNDTDGFTVSDYYKSSGIAGYLTGNSGPAIILRDGQTDILFGVFKSIMSRDKFFDFYYKQRYERRYGAFKRAYKNYIN